LVRVLGRLSRLSLLDLVSQWLEDKSIKVFPPYLAQDDRRGAEEVDDDEVISPYSPAKTVEELRGVYEELRARKGGKREVIDRILEGDWRHGISLRQLAMVDIRYIEDHPVGQRWTALRLVPTLSTRDQSSSSPTEGISTPLPRLHGSTFLQTLQREISPLVKAHYHLYRSKVLPLTFVRIFVIDSPYQYPRQSSYVFTDTARIIYLAFPDSSPFIYTSLASQPGTKQNGTATDTLTTDTRTLRKIVRDAIPKALSRPQSRYTLQSTSLTTKSLHTLLSLRGPGRTNSSGGAFSIFADAVAEGGPLDPRLPNSVPSENYDHNRTHMAEKAEWGDGDDDGLETRKENIAQSHLVAGTKATVHHFRGAQKDIPQLFDREAIHTMKKRKIVSSRFGTSGKSGPTSSRTTSTAVPALDRLEIHLQDPPITTPLSSDSTEPQDDNDDEFPISVTLTFTGTNVISGLRHLAELGVVDAQRMPSWMTGEEGISSAIVRGGRRRDV
jgi:central kinetochore subunit Mis15/CHL4